MNQAVTIILCDIDHTLSDASWRDPWLGEHGLDAKWDKYHSEAIHDQPIAEMVRVVNGLAHHDDIRVVGLTARPEKWRQLTMDWLVKHGIMIDELIMRPDADFDPAPVMKLNMVKGRFVDLSRLILIDDREDVVAAFKSEGITSLLVYARVRGDIVPGT